MSDTSASSSMEGRAEKRARVEEPAGAASVSPQAAAAAAIEALPDAVMSEIFRALGPRASWPLRAVCRRWRRSVEDTEWTSFELAPTSRADGKGRTQASAGRTRDGEQACVFIAVAELFGQRKLRLGAGASVTLRPELFAFKDAKATQQSYRPTVEAACSLLAAIAGSRGGSAQPQPREAIVELRGAEALSAFRWHSGDDFLDTFMLGVLRALAPPEGATSALESLSIGCVCDQSARDRFDVDLPWPEAAKLRDALAPFGKLRSLVLFSRRSFGAGPDAAAAVAAACPLLESLCVALDVQWGSESLAALAPLAHLKRLVVAWPLRGSLLILSIGDGLAALVDGPAGKSLRSVALFEDAHVGLYTEGEFPRPSPGARLASAELMITDAALLALGRMPRLESFRPLLIDPAEVDPAAILGLGRAASLREAVVQIRHQFYSPRTAACLRALAEAISGPPRLERLELTLCLYGNPRCPEAVADLLGSPGARRALTNLYYSIDRHLEEAEAEAILALPALQRLRLEPSLAPPASLRPFEVLAGLRPGIAVEIEFEGDEAEDVRAEVQRMFAGRPPYS
eukprot:tig00000269_g23694.t1